LHLGFYAPHPPLNPTREMFAPYEGAEIPPLDYAEAEWAGKEAPYSRMLHQCDRWSDEQLFKYKRHFYAMVTGVDMAIGCLLQRLEQNGELEDTLIVFCSDHGDMLGDHRMLGKGYTMYFDQVMRVPCVLYWPRGLGTAGRRVEGLVEMVDLLPTLLDLCGGHVPDVMVGRSYANELRAGEPLHTREDVIAYSHPDSAMLRTEQFKYCRFPHLGTDALFDLENDPHERVDISGKEPQIRAAMMERMLDRFLSASRSYREHHYLF
jgi:arylsulfatase